MRTLIVLAGLAVCGLASTARAQAPFVYKPIDANKMIVQPGDAVSGVAASASTSTFRTITRGIAGAIEGNGFVKTINNVLGRRAQPGPTVQNGFSPIPLASAYSSTRYANSFTPAMPIQQAYGRSAPVLTTTPGINR